MSTRNTGSFPQFSRSYSKQMTTANTNYTAPTTPGLLYVAGPDGSDIWSLAALPYGNQATANQLQLFSSPDGGTTFNLLPLSQVIASGFTQSQTIIIPVYNFAMPNGLPMGPSNPVKLSGVTNYDGMAMSQSTISELATYFHGGVTAGTANAQTLPYAYNSQLTLVPTTPTVGTIVDFEALLTNTASATLQVGLQSVAATMKRLGAGAAPANLSAGDITAGFRYRAIWDGTNWLVPITQRLYCAQGQAQNTVFTAWGADF